MTLTVALIAPGAMGAAIGKRLSENNVEVITSLKDRSERSRERAKHAGMRDVELSELMQADLLLSVVPPAQAEAIASKIAPLLADCETPPIYCDLNAISTATLARVERIVRDSGAAFVDGGIIGPPLSETKTPRIYVAGEQASKLAQLNDHGLDIRVLEGESGSASALKMCFAGINKGMTALTTIMLIAAGRSGAGDALRAELEHSLPEVITRIDSGIPDMLTKAWRWHPEMREIADFLDTSDPQGTNPAGRQAFEGFASLYEQLGDDTNNEALKTLLAGLIDNGSGSNCEGKPY
ncbi:NAD(P)-dependent oxidoreductase [Salinicola halimionae]|uniref:NAD(P)-dependent oxidoreductase n=1 Tax=Salinicola halimionae TaxID=1949081 RepID=UPI000DA1D329|nr:NAD(P)-dependent oxidoreductase [Salinicola halimionae]